MNETLREGPGVLGFRMGVEDLDAFLTGIGKARHEVQALRQDMVHAGAASKGVPLQSRDLRKVSDATLENARAQAKYRGEILQTDRDVGTLKGSMGGLAKAAAGVVVAYAGWQTINKAITDGLSNMKAMGTLGVVFDGPKSKVDALGASFDALARKVGIADDVLATAAAEAMRLGVAPDSVAGVIGQTAKTTQATYWAYGDINAILKATTNTANTYGLPLTPENAQRIQNILFQGVMAGAPSFGEIGEFVGLRGKGLEAMGVGMEEVPALLATLGKRGLEGQRALGAIHSLLDSLETPSPQVSEYADALGLPWSMGAVKSRGLGTWLQDMDRALKAKGGDKTSQILARLGVMPQSANSLLSMMAGGAEFEALRTSMRGGGDLIGPRFTAWESSPLAVKDRLGVLKGQGYEALGLGVLEGFAGANVDTAIGKLVDVQPKLNEFGEKLGVGASMLLDAALHLSGVRFGPDGQPAAEEGTNWLATLGAVGGAWGVAEMASRSKVLKGLWNLGKPVVTAAGGYLAGLPWATTAAGGTGIGASIANAALLPLKAGGYGAMGYLAGRGALEEGRMIAGAGQDPGFIPSIDSFEVFGLGDRDAYRVRQDLLKTRAEATAMSLEIMKNWRDTLGDMAGAVAEVFSTSTVVQILRNRLDEIKQRHADENILSVNVEIDHQQRIEFGDPNTKNKTGVRAKKGGAGRAEIHTGYRFFQMQNGTGVHAVRPMPENAIFAHVRRGYD